MEAEVILYGRGITIIGKGKLVFRNHSRKRKKG
jgi:hypothetical protein